MSTRRVWLALTFTSGARMGLDLASRRVADYQMVPVSPTGPSWVSLSALPEGNRLLAAKTHRRSRRGQTGVAKPSWLRSTNT